MFSLKVGVAHIHRSRKLKFSCCGLIFVAVVHHKIHENLYTTKISTRTVDSIEAPYNIYDCRQRIRIRKPAY